MAKLGFTQPIAIEHTDNTTEQSHSEQTYYTTYKEAGVLLDFVQQFIL
jgi:hypothetical protein